MPSTALREVSLLQMLSETEFVVRCVLLKARFKAQRVARLPCAWRGEARLRAIGRVCYAGGGRHVCIKSPSRQSWDKG